MTKEELWQAILGDLELSLSKANFTTWFKKTFISLVEDDHIVISVPNDFTKTWLEKKYHKAILETLQNLTDDKIKKIIYKIEVKAIANAANLETSPMAASVKVETRHKINEFGLNPQYSFSRFVVGKNNELAHAACQHVAKSPGEKYNPLFIYSGVGLGKTHLMQAVGHQIIEKFRKKKILYASCEKFTNDYIQAVREGNAKEFKNLYRNVDLLLIDDIQFMTGKEGTQEEFFHTFNELHQKNKQIVITSDRPPKAIPGLEERLSSRFGWGMITDISKPDLEMRTAIFRSKCQEKNYALTEDIANYVASYIQNNIRELEGALNKIIAFHELNNTIPTIDSVKAIISNLISQPRQGATTPRQLIKLISEFYEIKLEDLLGVRRTKTLALPRQIAMYLLRTELNTSYPAIGQELGNRDHTTAIHACNKIKKEIENESRIKQDIEMIKQRLYAM
ncbi:MAG: chromosomal replication initiator protein [Parcubacteria group bacterium Athens0714_12]|nr:MAG: chromosomal replication initiator protein [Parcubacteria group bacterium Athens0714_12]